MKFVSIDGGATKTIGVLYNENFEILDIGLSGPSNFRTVGIGVFRRNIRDVVKKINEDVNEITFALPGIKDSHGSMEKITDELRLIFPGKRLKVYNDGEAGFHSRFPEGNGMVAAAGTGMVCYGKLRGNSVRASGWGWFLDDEGGAFYIGRRALEEVVRIVDGRGDFDSTLVDEIKRHYSLESFSDLINIVYRGRIDVRSISSIAILVSSNAIKGDLLSMKIMEESALATSRAIVSTYKKLSFPEDIGLSGYGGVFRSGAWYWEMVKDFVSKKIKIGKIKEPYFGYEAVIGSVVLKYSELGIDIKDNDLEKLRKGLNENLERLDKKLRMKYLYF
jgi:N-acetylglucosamine kinase-like BadF-type ATPase